MSYTALYRKYRPARFSDVVGQEHIVQTLKNQISSGKVSHAYLFCGTRGTGKTSMAKIFAKAINCLAPEHGEPCCACTMCREIARERSLNVIEIDAASNNGVDNIRELREEVKYTPTQGQFKVYIIDEVHMLSAGAYNALLKTLEEPPAHAIFILATTDPQRIPATIHSRCQRYDFKRIPTAAISARLADYMKLEGITAAKEALDYVAALGDGSMRDSLSLLDRCISFFDGEEITLQRVLDITGSISNQDFFDFTAHLNQMDCEKALLAVERMAQEGRDIGQIILEALAHFRSILIAQSVDNCAPVLDISPERAETLQAQSKTMDRVRVLSYITAFSELQNEVKYHPNPRLLLEIKVIQLCNPEVINQSYESLYNKVLRLERDLAGAKLAPPSPASSAPVAKKEPSIPIKKIVLKEDFAAFQEKFPAIKAKLQERREAHAFAGVLEKAEIGFLDDAFVYIIFEDSTNEAILKDHESRQAMLNDAVAAVLGKRYPIKTIVRQDYEAKSLGVTIVQSDKAKQSDFTQAIEEGFEGFPNIEYDE